MSGRRVAATALVAWAGSVTWTALGARAESQRGVFWPVELDVEDPDFARRWADATARGRMVELRDRRGRVRWIRPLPGRGRMLGRMALAAAIARGVGPDPLPARHP